MASLPAVPAAALLLLLPVAALAHGEPFDPNLHVDPSVDDCSVRFASTLTQDAFHRFTREFGSVSAFKQGSPPATLGQGGFAVDVEQIYFSVEDKSAAWNDTFVHPDGYHPLGSDKAFPKLRLRLGVTDDLDVGAFYTKSPEANYGWVGFEAKYAILQQGDDMPVSLAVRGAYTKTLYVADMNMQAAGIDVTVGRTFWKILTPYVGVGTDAVLAIEKSDAVDLENEHVTVPHLTAGAELRYWHVAIGAEAQRSDVNSLQAQVSVVF